MKSNDHSSIQAHSMGELFPCVIARIERYAAGETAATESPSVSWELSLDGRSEEYATRDDAEEVARALLRDDVVRHAWNGHAIAAIAPRERSMGGYGDANPGRAADLGGRRA